LGKTNRAETNEVLSSLSEDEYAMRIINDKIVVVGSSDIATQKAIEEFRNKYISKFEKGKQTVIEKSSTFSGFYDGVVDLCEGAELRVMTLNVALSGDEPSKRIEHIINLVEQYEPDIFCLQECNAFMHTNLVYKLKTNYGIAFEKHQDSDVYIYTPILYRKDKIKLVEGGGEWLDSRYVGTNTKCLSWGVFELNSTDEKIFVLSLHGAVLNNSYSGYENKSKEELQAEETKMRADNVRQMLDVEKSIQKKYGKLPAIFAGDFNFAKNELPYQVATNAGLTEAEVSATVSKMPGYKTTHSVGEPPTTEARYSIDHIFYYPESIKAYVHYVGVKTEDELWASDHLMVYSDVEILG
jgi:endonuclease/exonuclease/phosphatase family metal-dependent hydrolase